MALIEVKKLSRIYNIIDGKRLLLSQKLFNNLDFSVEESEFVSVVGPSGSGKTTFLNIIGTLDSIEDRDVVRVIDNNTGKEITIPRVEGSGSVFINKQDISRLKGDSRAKFINSNIGFIFQSHHLIPELTALQNVALPMRILGKSKKDTNDRAHELLNDMGLSKYATKKPAVLSGGEKQRVAIARALVNHPKILLADEPTGSLQPGLKDEIIDLFSKLNKENGLTILMITHDVERLYREDQTLKIDRLFDLGNIN